MKLNCILFELAGPTKGLLKTILGVKSPSKEFVKQYGPIAQAEIMEYARFAEEVLEKTTNMIDVYEIKADVDDCPRCGGDHQKLIFKHFGIPPKFDPLDLDEQPVCTHWSPCPTTGEPILVTLLGPI